MIEEWRHVQIKEDAVKAAKRIVTEWQKAGIEINEDDEQLITDRVDIFVASKWEQKAIELYERQVLFNETRRAIERLLTPLSLEESLPCFDIRISGVKKAPVKSYYLLDREKVASPEDVFERASQCFKATSVSDPKIDKETFLVEVEKLMAGFKDEYPQFFDDEGNPRTTIQVGWLPPYKLTKKELTYKNLLGRNPLIEKYRNALKITEEYLHKVYKWEYPKKVFPLSGYNKKLNIDIQHIKQILQQQGIVLFLPEAYHGYSPEFAREHAKSLSLEDRFRLCDPLTGLQIAIQNLELFDRNKSYPDRVQVFDFGYHGALKDNQLIGLLIGYDGAEFDTVKGDRAGRDVSSGVLYSPNNFNA